MSENRKKIKVTDRRMFTPDGDLRDEFKDLKDAPVPKAVAERPTEVAPEETHDAASTAAQASPRGPVAASNAGPGQSSQGRPQEPAGRPGGPIAEAPVADDEATESGAQFYDLVAMLAQTASVYLNQAAQQLEQRGELLEMSRMHIDLLSVLDKKTHGNLSREEKAMLDDAIYRLRMALVEIGG